MRGTAIVLLAVILSGMIAIGFGARAVYHAFQDLKVQSRTVGQTGAHALEGGQ